MEPINEALPAIRQGVYLSLEEQAADDQPTVQADDQPKGQADNALASRYRKRKGRGRGKGQAKGGTLLIR